ncbi:MAG: DUF937 domain-containing protein [Prevotellaceae bacterium]|jgi:hypothetical protein|nr:DUF937 domain-containing protein [Prevotellaceae bacterium]
MTNLSDLLNSDLGKQIISGIGKQTGATQKETSSVLATALPAILGGLQKNASQGGADGIMNALTKHDGSVLDNLTDFLGKGKNVSDDGKGILGHIFGEQLGAVTGSVSKQSGVSKAKTASIIEMAAPVLMGYLGKQTKSSGVTSGGGLEGLLGGLLGGSGGGNVLTGLLDQNGDGKLDIADVASVVTGTNKNKGGGLLGGLLSGIFGKK